MSHPQPAAARFDDPVLAAMAARRSISKVGPQTPNDDELLTLLDAVTPVADHKALRPWRLLTIRGDDRLRLGAALDAAAGREPGDKPNPKPLRAELLIAVIASPTEHPKVPVWEHHATAAGAAHLLELALWQAGWGVMWRTGLDANAPAVRALHGLNENELLMGWLYVGDIDPAFRKRLETSRRPPKDPSQFLSTLPAPEAVAAESADAVHPAGERIGQRTDEKAAKTADKKADKKAEEQVKKSAQKARKKAKKKAKKKDRR
ncbi:nitroreductase family protein [Brevibacterium luteolum]|uniref:nitroreductase family protein n=1 Tax=Brevibacterium luteolum TaxID=199591 RepID=UPI00223B6493|nr:nitroreductase family protein [Brevibacterium luteolum]MCT1828475.1 nitroreductase family protein [Brevibacterium luteolum]